MKTETNFLSDRECVNLKGYEGEELLKRIKEYRKKNE